MTAFITLPVTKLYAVAGSLASDDGENPEYDRALTELLVTLLHLPMDGGRELVENQIAVAKHLDRRENPCD